jgi:hypothetical protein
MKQFITIAFCALLLFLTGCGTNPIRPYQPASPSSSERKAQESGVEVALDPFLESSRTKQYFDIDAVGKGIAILHVRVANKTANQTFLVEKKNFQLVRSGAAGGLTGDGKKIERSTAAGNAVAWVGMGGLSMLAAGGLVSHSTEIQRNFTNKEMGNASLSPGESMEGFIYFTPVNHGEDWTQNAVVKINLTETKTQQVIELNIPLSH